MQRRQEDGQTSCNFAFELVTPCFISWNQEQCPGRQQAVGMPCPLPSTHSLRRSHASSCVGARAINAELHRHRTRSLLLAYSQSALCGPCALLRVFRATMRLACLVLLALAGYAVALQVIYALLNRFGGRSASCAARNDLLLSRASCERGSSWPCQVYPAQVGCLYMYRRLRQASSPLSHRGRCAAAAAPVCLWS